jgi:hypothetical protein
MKQFSSFSLLCLLFTLACSPKNTVLTPQLWSENNWSEKDLNFLQFYLSEDLTLKREIKNGFRHTSGGTELIDGKQFEIMEFKKNQTGKLVKRLPNNQINVSFEVNNESRFLIFAPDGGAKSHYHLVSKQNKVDFAGTTFEIMPGIKQAYLTFR